MTRAKKTALLDFHHYMCNQRRGWWNNNKQVRDLFLRYPIPDLSDYYHKDHRAAGNELKSIRDIAVLKCICHNKDGNSRQPDLSCL
jgi:hypothetical protein